MTEGSVEHGPLGKPRPDTETRTNGLALGSAALPWHGATPDPGTGPLDIASHHSDGLNAFAYAGSNPGNRVDPSG